MGGLASVRDDEAHWNGGLVRGPRPSRSRGHPSQFGEGRMGSALMRPLQISCFFGRGTFWVLPLTNFDIPKTTFFSNLSKCLTFAAAPLALTPFVRNQSMLKLINESLQNIAACYFNTEIVERNTAPCSGGTSRRRRRPTRTAPGAGRTQNDRSEGGAGRVCVYIYIYIYI